MRKRDLTLVVGGALAGLVAASVPAYAYPTQTLNPDTGAGGGTYVIGVSFTDDNGAGGFITWKGGAPCTGSYGDLDYTEKSLNEEAANDEISSFTDANFCDTKFYRDSNFGGGATAWLDAGSSPDNLGSQWNDEASSIKWT